MTGTSMYVVQRMRENRGKVTRPFEVEVEVSDGFPQSAVFVVQREVLDQD